MSDFENLHGMIIFARVVETLSYTEAAKTLGLAKSSVSKEISALEVRLGAKLLQRTTRRIQVTEVGMTYYHYCYRILHEVKSADLFIRQFHEEPTGSLRVVAPVTFGCQCIVPVLNSFVAGNIHVSIDLDLTDRPVNLEDDHFDIAIAITRDLPDHRHYRPLIDIAWGLYAAPGYLSKLNAIASPDDLPRQDFILFRGPAHTISLPFRKEKQKKDIEVRSRFRANNSIALLNSAVAQTGIAYLPNYIAQEAVESGRLVQILPDWEMDIYKSYILVKSDNFISPRVRLFIEDLQKALQE
ncbi:LysR family transcriptional regulator [bacteria symbiont BFo1 of Frankliniella occidentalis]|jgi:DNA-binding transcriptional LysR family regulator|uniref:LysR family transcriptional regulator n=1 Tax=Erwinia aphidicola TaxID=68334 RepID=A0ABU8DHA4_ERWAP|nr:LysR family transcriptional regulator [Erwinia aphidicola]KYP83292.1 LysR family transcriptional regulator [bacteria symbiont BFo1 of Frankliniella occidentalis]PIJ55859.1 LysR family transcriptional regulator [Erwinia sp. OLMDLW33]KYP88306.1 LysR family transcriptional regulator [bacteria symbiont BFo1 of Frankliniella occidentalis]MBD1375354.1 LysR family transcriptional regulator [Erwinia aphidicola]MBN1084444.1 LysR family transcriptional regulator [Erwinia aphidicola]